MTEALRIVGEATDHAQLIAVIRAWVAQLDMTYDGIDKLAGLPDRYVNKILRPIPIKGLNRHSMGPILGALGLKLVVVVNTEHLERLAKRKVQLGITPSKWTEKRKATAACQRPRKLRANAGQLYWTANSAWGKFMSDLAIVKTTPDYRQRAARKAGKASARKRRKIRDQLCPSAAAPK